MKLSLTTPKVPTRDWARKLPSYLHTKLSLLHNDNLFIDRDHLDQEIITVQFIPSNLNDIHINNHKIIALVSKAFETICIWENILPNGYVKPITTFIIIGYEQDVLLTHQAISYIINGTNNLHKNLVDEYRRKKLNQRRRTQSSGKKIVYKQPDARSLAVKYLNNTRANIVEVIEGIEMKFSVLHSIKLLAIEKYILSIKKLNMKKYKGVTRISHAHTKRRVLNRIII